MTEAQKEKHRIYMRGWTKRNHEKVLLSKRKHRDKHKERINKERRQYFDEHREQLEESRRIANRKWRANNKRKVQVHNIVNTAIRNGELVRPEYCSKCHSPAKVEAHHTDYSRPFYIHWLCHDCHTELHKKPRIGRTP